MKALVTGASGLIGANLVRELIANGYDTVALVRPSSDLSGLANLPVMLLQGDVLQPESLIAAAAGCDLIFHAAAYFRYSLPTAADLARTAVEGSLNVLTAAHVTDVRRVVLTSSSVVMGSNATRQVRDETADLQGEYAPPYVLAKVQQERAAIERSRELGIELVVVNPTMAVGAHAASLGPSNEIITTYMSDPFRITYPGGCNIVSVHDVARGHRLAAERGAPGCRYLLGSENLEWSTIHRTISQLCGVPGPLIVASRASAYCAAASEELVAKVQRRRPRTTREQAKMVGRYYWYSHARAAALGYAPRPARQALAEAISWLVTSRHVTRETRTSLKLSREVYDARQRMSAWAEPAAPAARS